MEAKYFWERASTCPLGKPEYPDHARLREFAKAKGKVVLEYGCGGGSDTMEYLRHGAEVYFADIVPHNLDLTTARIISDFELSKGKYVGLQLKDSSKVPLKASSVDIVSSHGVVHHIAHPAPVVKDFFRVLKPGGELHLMLYTEHLWAFHEERINELTRNEKISKYEAFGWCTDEKGCPYARAYTEKEGVELIEKAGFEMLWLETYAPTVKDKEANRLIFRHYKARKKG